MSQHTVERLRAEFVEMPGLRLTPEQARRLCGVELGQCAAALDTLVREKFLCAKPDGTYARLTDGEPQPRPRLLKASIPDLPGHRQAS